MSARDWLDGLMCSRLPEQPGRVGLAYFLTDMGNLLGESTIAMLDSDRLWYGSAAAAEIHDMDWLQERLPVDSEIDIKSLTNDYTTLVIAGPNSHQLLQSVSERSDWSNEAFPWMSVRHCYLGHVEAVVMAVSFSGELGFELHIPNSQLYAAYQILFEAGKAFGLSHFGMYALESMRLEKGYGHWKTDLISEYNPVEAGLQRFVDMDKTFPGKKGLQAQLNDGLKKKRVLLVIDNDLAPAQAGEAVFKGNDVVGTITSAAWGYRVKRNIAMAYIQPQFADTGSKLEILLLGQRVGAEVAGSCLYDADNKNMGTDH